MSEENTQRERNQSILDTYDGSDISHPQVILRKVNQVDGDILDDELFGVKLSSYREYDVSRVRDQLPENFKWAANGIVDFITQYNELLKHPTERIHLEALAQNGRIFIENRCSSTNGNSKEGGNYAGMLTSIYGKPAIILVAPYCDKETLLHEAIHNSDLRLYMYKGSFSAQKIYQTAIMMLDAQKITSDWGYKSVKCLRKINKIYQAGEIYDEGLAWITSMPMEELAKEKNHIGKNLKVLHSLYTEASVSLKNQLAVIDCFRFWEPSPHIAKLLDTYNKNGQKVGKERDKILKQQKHFWDEMMKFRKEINKLKLLGLEKTMCLHNALDNYCRSSENNGIRSLLPAYIAQDKADKAYRYINEDDSITPNEKKRQHLSMLKTLFYDIKPNDLNNPSQFAEKYMICLDYYSQMSDEFRVMQFGYDLFPLLNRDEKLSGIAARKMLYDNLKARIEIARMQIYFGCSAEDSTLAYLYNENPASVTVGDKYVQVKLNEADSIEQKRQYVAEMIDQAQEVLQHKTATNGRFMVNAVKAMKYLLEEYSLYQGVNGIQKIENLRSFNTSKKVVRDLQWLKAKDGDDGLPTEMYQYFEPGIIADYCSRPASAFNPKSEDYVPNNYKNPDSQKVAYTRALYEFLALRHTYQARTHCKNFPKDMQFRAFEPNSNRYRQIRAAEATRETPLSETNSNTGK